MASEMVFEFHSKPPTMRERILLRDYLVACRRSHAVATRKPLDITEYNVAQGDVAEALINLLECRLIGPICEDDLLELDMDDTKPLVDAYDAAYRRSQQLWLLARSGSEPVEGES